MRKKQKGNFSETRVWGSNNSTHSLALRQPEYCLLWQFRQCRSRHSHFGSSAGVGTPEYERVYILHSYARV